MHQELCSLEKMGASTGMRWRYASGAYNAPYGATIHHVHRMGHPRGFVGQGWSAASSLTFSIGIKDSRYAWLSGEREALTEHLV
jgi:hypothetical protein